jgi:PiT family inorganic phosphate transporter
MFSLLGGVFLGWSLGANDASNVIGSAVASRMLKFRTAAFLAAAFVLIGALIQGHAGIDTLKGLTLLDLQDAVISSVAAAITVLIMTLLGLPVSTSQAVVGAILGVGILQRQLNFLGLGKVVACWVGTPLGGILAAVIIYNALGFVYNKLKINLFQSDALMRVSLIAAASYGAFSLGANNVANVTAVFVGAGHLDLFFATFVGGLSICLGILTFSRRVMETVGKRIVQFDAFSALVVLLAEAVTVHFYTFLGVPVSTSQAVIGAVLGVGMVKGINTIQWRHMINIVVGWFFTPAVACFVAIGIDFITHLQYVPVMP